MTLAIDRDLVQSEKSGRFIENRLVPEISFVNLPGMTEDDVIEGALETCRPPLSSTKRKIVWDFIIDARCEDRHKDESALDPWMRATIANMIYLLHLRDSIVATP